MATSDHGHALLSITASESHLADRNRKLEIFTMPTKAKSQKPAYSQAFNRNIKGLKHNILAFYCC